MYYKNINIQLKKGDVFPTAGIVRPFSALAS